jgi:flagellar hook-associated protein 1 FlgK
MGLVVGSTAFKLTAAAVDNGAMQHVFAQGQDITDKLYSGEIGGALSIRDTFIPDLISQLNSLASNLATSFNAVHSTGYTLDNDTDPATTATTGIDFFVPPTGAQAAAMLQINPAVLSSYKNIAVSSDGTPGNNGKLDALIAVEDLVFIAARSTRPS